MDRQVGTAGERHICLVVQTTVQHLNDVITAFPSAYSTCR
jgi:hypothetical protein